MAQPALILHRGAVTSITLAVTRDGTATLGAD